MRARGSFDRVLLCNGVDKTLELPADRTVDLGRIP